MAGKIRVGVVGCGRISRGTHIPTYNAIKDVEVASLYDLKRDKAEFCRKELAPGAGVFTNFNKFLDSGLDAVSVCSPSYYHCEQTVSALKKGMHVLCEKPMAVDLKEATRMISTAKKAGKVLHINQSRRYNPTTQAIAELISKGAIGKIMHIRRIRTHAQDPSKSWSPGAKWFITRKHGGVLLDIGIHEADMMKWLAGPVSEVAGDVRSITPGISASESVAAVLRFANRATGVLELKWNQPVESNEVEIYGSGGAIFGPDPSDNEYRVFPPEGSRKKPKVVKVKPRGKVKNSMQSFILAVKGEEATPTPGEVGRDALAICIAMQESSDTGKFVKVKKWR